VIIYITAVNGDFSTNIPNQCVVLPYIVQNLDMIVTISSAISELPFSSSKNSRFIYFLFFFLTGMYNAKY